MTLNRDLNYQWAGNGEAVLQAKGSSCANDLWWGMWFKNRKKANANWNVGGEGKNEKDKISAFKELPIP